MDDKLSKNKKKAYKIFIFVLNNYNKHAQYKKSLSNRITYCKCSAVYAMHP